MASLLDRHPRLVLENCGSGGLRMDYAQLAVAQLQSTSDQQDPFRYPPIAAAAATAATPEQAAVWAYPSRTTASTKSPHPHRHSSAADTSPASSAS
ncbi:hypothetical protein ACFWBB_05175 [Streptomyces sp. NPDC060000]|uniref:hypothetical protein n=1 Tax=Streptomyces sp. NPDC060000 TaxID=3347031 RepID=UPI0036C3A464